MQADATGMLQMAIDATQSGISLGVLCKRWPLGTTQMGYVQHILPRQGKNERPAAKVFICSRTGNLFSTSRASEGRFHARPVILRHPVRRKAAFCHGNTSGRHRGLAKGGSPATGADCGELCGSLLAAPVAQPDILFLSQRSPCCAKTVSGMHRKSYLHDDE